ncbi:Pseudopaline exporter CntI [Burkholderiales bacterium]|nr:MAG: DMT family transporter [Burkholderiales bacterium]CAG1006056.1 Pseudopaline exporter CntI [Burkholderiales bacterium]
MQSLWILVSGFFFALMGVFVKLGAAHFATAELVFYRSLTTLAVALLMLRWQGLAWRSDKPWMHCKRGLTGFVSLLLFFQAIALLPLATAMTLNYTSPIFLTLLTVLLLRESPRPLLLLALALGFGGTVLLLRPTLKPEEMLGAALGLASGFAAALAYYNVRQLVRAHEPESRVVLYFGVYATLGAGLWMLGTEWHAITWPTLWILLGMGFCGTFGQLAVTRAYGKGRAAVTAALSYGTVVFSSVLGIIIWQDQLPLTSWLAMGLIMLGGVLAVSAVPARADARVAQTND